MPKSRSCQARSRNSLTCPGTGKSNGVAIVHPELSHMAKLKEISDRLKKVKVQAHEFAEWQQGPASKLLEN
jgi:hypothetical protein